MGLRIRSWLHNMLLRPWALRDLSLNKPGLNAFSNALRRWG